MKEKIKSFLNLFSSNYLDERTNFNARLAMILNFIWSSVKIGFGIWKMAYFFCISGVFTLLIGACKYIYLKGYKKYQKDTKNELPYFKKIGIILIFASFVYIIYMGKLFFFPEHSTNYGLIFSITIALISTIEIIISIRGFIKMFRSKEIMQIAIKCVSICTACTNIVLTQVCLLEACTPEENMEMVPIYNAISGVAFGFICLCIGTIMLLSIEKIDHNTNINIRKSSNE